MYDWIIKDEREVYFLEYSYMQNTVDTGDRIQPSLFKVLFLDKGKFLFFKGIWHMSNCMSSNILRLTMC